jgi:hypothetical protein
MWTVSLQTTLFRAHGLKSAGRPITVATTHIGRALQHPPQQELIIRKLEAVGCSETSENSPTARHRKPPQKEKMTWWRTAVKTKRTLHMSAELTSVEIGQKKSISFSTFSSFIQHFSQISVSCHFPIQEAGKNVVFPWEPTRLASDYVASHFCCPAWPASAGTVPAIAHIYFSWSCKVSWVSEGSKVEGKKYGGDVLAVREFLQIDLLFFTTRFVCFVRSSVACNLCSLKTLGIRRVFGASENVSILCQRRFIYPLISQYISRIWHRITYITYGYLCNTLLLLLLLTAIELSLVDSSPYSSTDKTNKNKYT